MSRTPYFDATFLHFGAEGRGIPRVIRQWTELILGYREFDSLRFYASAGPSREALASWGVPESRMDRVALPPGPLARERFHGSFAGWRCRGFKSHASAWIHPEVRGVFSTALPRLVMHYDFIVFHPESVQGPLKPFRRPWYAYKNRLAAQGAAGSLHLAISTHTLREAKALFPEYGRCDFRALPLGGGFPGLSDAEEKAGPESGDGVLEFLYVGACEGRKNVPALIAALPLLHPERRIRLTLVGMATGAQAARMREAVSGLPDRCEVRWLGQVEDAVLAQAYRQAHFFVTASLFEGFGLPLVEAMALGVPVLAFANSAIPETLGDVGFVAENGDFAAWGRRVESAVSNPAIYKEWSRAGRSRTADFTEAAMKSRYAEALREFLGRVVSQ